MSAYIIDPITLDYILTWYSERNHRDEGRLRVYPDAPDLPIIEITLANPTAVTRMEWGSGVIALVDHAHMTTNDLGQILMAENHRSVFYRYPDATEDDAPGTFCGDDAEQKNARVWEYRFKRVNVEPDARWVIRSLDCLGYQSCEAPDYRQTVAYALAQAIRERAIRTLVGEDAPWGVTDSDLEKIRAKNAETRAAIRLSLTK